MFTFITEKIVVGHQMISRCDIFVSKCVVTLLFPMEFFHHLDGASFFHYEFCRCFFVEITTVATNKILVCVVHMIISHMTSFFPSCSPK